MDPETMTTISYHPRSRPPGGMVDLHCHLLPGIDDGSRHLEQSLNMARLAVADGIVIVTATPHHLNGVFRNPAGAVREHYAAFTQALREQGIALDLRLGAECHLVPELPAALRAGTALTIADRRKAVLVELPVHSVPMGAVNILEEIIAQGLQPVIAHPERNRTLAESSDLLMEWVEMGCLAQVTAQSCTGQFGSQIQSVARRMIRDGLIHVMASDAHRDRRRIPQLSAGRDTVGQWFSPELARLLTEDAPRALADGERVPTEEIQSALMTSRKGWSHWWRRLRA